MREFLTETNENLDRVDAELVRFEQDPNNVEILGNIFRLVHTIKGTCGFLGLPRLETLAHAAETLMGKFRDGMPVTAEAVTSFSPPSIASRSSSTDRSAAEQEPDGGDGDLIDAAGPHGAAGRRKPPPPAAPRASSSKSPSNSKRPTEPYTTSRAPTTSAATGSPVIRSASTSIRSII